MYTTPLLSWGPPLRKSHLPDLGALAFCAMLPGVGGGNCHTLAEDGRDEAMALFMVPPRQALQALNRSCSGELVPHWRPGVRQATTAPVETRCQRRSDDAARSKGGELYINRGCVRRVGLRPGGSERKAADWLIACTSPTRTGGASVRPQNRTGLAGKAIPGNLNLWD